MRFVYIDREGRELELATVDALRRAAEEGSILPSTPLEDRLTGTSAPAGEHRVLQGVTWAPLPEHGGEEPAAESPEESSPEESSGGREEPVAGEGWIETFAFDLEALDLAAEPPGSPDGGETGAFDLSDLDELPPEELSEPGASAQVFELAPGPEAELELEPPFGAENDPGHSGSWIESIELEPAIGGWPLEAPDADPPAAEGALPPPSGEAEPPSATAPAAPPAGAPPGFVPPPAAQGGGPAGRSPRAAPRPLPPPPGRGPRIAPAATLLLLLAVSVGGWFGWSAFHGRGEDPVAPGGEPVSLPPLPPELEPLFREAAPDALGATADRLLNVVGEGQMPHEPPPDWLSGRYLANASRYPEVEAYFTAARAALEEIRRREEGVFQEQLAARVGPASTPEDSARIVERGVAGFRASAPEREAAYGALAEVLSAALGLHEFLVANETQIDFDPAAGGISRDPVLEAVPRTRQLADEVWGRVDQVTRALEGMGGLGERVTTSRLFSLALARVAQGRIR